MQTVVLNVDNHPSTIPLIVSENGGVTLTVEQVRYRYIDRPSYGGSYLVVPGIDVMVLHTAGLLMDRDLIIGASIAICDHAICDLALSN